MTSDRFQDALAYAERLHRAQTRKGNDIPYLAHLLAVCAIVLEWRGDEDTAIAALLHDAVEDQGGLATLHAIRDRFGARVAEIVAACSDSAAADPHDRAPWEERKAAHIRALADATAEVALVAAADKLHNLQSMLRDVRRDGPQTMARFNASPERILWFNRAVAQALAPHRDWAPVDEVEAASAELAAVLGLTISA